MATDERFLAAAQGDDLIGFCSFRDNKIEGLFVQPDHARRGVGTALLAAAEATMCRGATKTVVLEAALPAVPFYEARGYIETRSKRCKTRGGLEIEACDMVKTR